MELMMHRQGHRALATLAAALATLALAASPALAGSDGCDEDGCAAENSPSPVVPVTPQPQTIAPAPQPASGPNTSPLGHRAKDTRTVTVAQRGTTAPRGAVSAGAGGTAPDDALSFLAGAGVVLLVAGGGIVASAHGRRS
jgi:hypothetical protein